MTTYNVSFVTKGGRFDETQLDVENHLSIKEDYLELLNLILSLKDEMSIDEVLDIKEE